MWWYVYFEGSRFAAAVMMEYSGVDVGLVIYLCLKNTFPDILGLHVSFTSISISDSVQKKCEGHRP